MNDHKSLVIELMFLGFSKLDYEIFCSSCKRWVSAFTFKNHLRKMHGFILQDNEKSSDELKGFVKNIRPR